MYNIAINNEDKKMTKEEKIAAVRSLMEEMTSSESLGKKCAEEMGIDEEDLWDVRQFVLDLLKKEEDK